MAMGPAVSLAILLVSTCIPPPYAAASSSTFQRPPPLHHEPHPSPSPSSSPEYESYIIVLKPRPDAHLLDDGAREAWYRSFLPAGVTSNGEPRLVRSYKTLFHGFAARLTAEELRAMSGLPGFGRWFPDGTRYPATTRTPAFLGLDKDDGLWHESNFGNGAVIGVLDSGINSIHPSFDDDGMPPPPARWKGRCTGWGVAPRCNNKLIGAQSFVSWSPWDEVGHGTHVASTAAGRFVANASSSHGGELAAGTAAGIAPGAHVAMYKVCDHDGCADSAIISAMDAAVQDGVDVISISLGYGPRDQRSLDKDAVAIGAFRAVAKGVVVVAAAGNYGPLPGSIENGNAAPWIITVGAGSLDRRLPADLVLETGDIIPGEALVPGKNSTGYLPLFYPGAGEASTCNGIKAGSPVKGRIVICDVAVDKDAAKVQFETLVRLYDYSYGAALVVLINRDASGYSVRLTDLGAPVVQLSAAAGHKLKEYSQMPDAAAQVLFRPTEIGVKPSPIVAAFSGRGPSRNNPYLLKPDVLAPGLNVLAAGGQTAAPTFVIDSGTSMATPHISGVAALLKSVHPEWSPAAVRSAITSMAGGLGNDGPIKDEQYKRAGAFALGAGLPDTALFPVIADQGLVYDMSARDYGSFLCYYFNRQHGGATVDLLHDILLDLRLDDKQDYDLNCADLPSVPDYDLNYPTIFLPAKMTVQRTLTNVNVDKEVEEYEVTCSFLDKTVEVNISPRMLRFSEPGQKLSFNVSAKYQGKGANAEGYLLWISDIHVVTSKIVVEI